MEKLLTVQEVAELLNVKVGTVYHYNSLNDFIPQVKIYGKVRYDRDDVTRWIEARKIGGRIRIRKEIGCLKDLKIG